MGQAYQNACAKDDRLDAHGPYTGRRMTATLSDTPHTDEKLGELAGLIRQWGLELGFQQIGIAGVEPGPDEERFMRWLEQGCHGEMDYMQRYGARRARPNEIVPGTLRVISARMDYLPGGARDAEEVLADPQTAYVSRYALGRDYHKVMRRRLATLAERIQAYIASTSYRVFVDSGPILEKVFARNAGLGWIGKHTNLIHRRAGSWFFLGEILTDLPLPIDEPATEHCGTCRKCIDVCPTGAIVAPFQLDARRCISYLTIELHGPIPEEFRKAIGNRIYGCDDCQLVCPWNKFARLSAEPDFAPRHRLDQASLVELFAWSESEFLARTEGSAIRRIGYERWLRNIAIALGNAPTTPAVIEALNARKDHPSALVREHVLWALEQHRGRMPASEGN
ncbi:MAG TPA: tRNA epoxyqueuosine(34) reductase QueG [Steroidobacter sp.]